MPGPLVAALDRGDASHEWAVAQLRALRGPLLTCGAVLAEATFVLRLYPPATARLRVLVESGHVQPADETGMLWARALALMEHYVTVPMSFVDACLVALMEAHQKKMLQAA
jgi:uncharacterized protein